MRKFFTRVQPYWPIIILAVILLALFYRVIFLGEVYYDGDNFHLNIPQKYFFVNEIMHGRVPLWNPYIFTGIPYFADLNLGSLNPLNVLYFIFPISRALTLFSILDIFLIGVFQYLFLRLWKFGNFESLVGAVIFMLSGSTFVFIDNVTYLHPIVYIPLLFSIITLLNKSKKESYIFLLSFTQALQIFSGHPQITYYTYLWVTFFLVFFTQFRLKTRIILAAYYVIFSLGVASVQLLPFLEYVLQATRPLSSIKYAGWGSLNLPGIVPMIFPTIYGTRLLGTWWGPQTMIYGYIGTASFVLFGIGFRFGKIILNRIAFIGIIGSFLLALGSTTPLFYLSYYLIPGWRLLRAPSGMLVYFGFFASIICAFGLKRISENPKIFIPFSKIIFYPLLFFTTLSGGIYLYLQTRQNFWQKIFSTLLEHFHIQFLNKILIYDQDKLFAMFQGILLNVFIFLVVMCSMAFILGFLVKRNHIYKVSIFLLVLIPFLFFNFQYILTTNIHFWDTNKDIPIALQTVQKGTYRMLTLQVNMHQNRSHLPGPDFFYQEGLANLAMYHEDQSIPYSLSQASGYTSLIPKGYAEFIQGKKGGQTVTNIDFSRLTLFQANHVSIKYILSQSKLSSYQNIPLQLIDTKKGKYYIYENKTALPRAYTFFGNGSKNVKFGKNYPSQIELSVESPAPNFLILTDLYYPGWKAYVNGKETPIDEFAGTFRMVNIPEGKSQVQFVYEPNSIKVGLLVSILTLLGTGTLLFLRRKTKIA